MKNLTFKAAMLNDSRTTVERRSTDGQSQRHYKQTPLSKRWKVLMTLVFLFTLAIGQMWAGVITAAASTDLGSGETPRYVVEQSGVGRLMKNATGSSSWTLSNSKYLQTGSSKFALQTYKEISSIVITGYGTGNNRTFSSMKVGTTTSNYTAASATGSGTMSSTESAQTITITPSSNIAANSYIEITLSGNVNIASVELVEAGGGSDVCPETLTISSKDSKTAFTEGDKVELTASLAKGNGTISYQWYKGSVAPANAISGATTNKLTINSCAVSDAGDYYCVASKTSCDNVTSPKFAITVEADTKCFNMPAITSKPSDLAHVTVTGGTLSDASVSGKAIAFKNTGLGLGGGNDARLKVTLTGASIVEGTKITINYNDASTDGNGSGLAIYDGDHNNKTLNSTGLKNSGSVSHTFTAEEAVNYDDEFIIDRNQTGKGIIMGSITVEDCGPAVTKHTITLNYNDGVTPNGSIKVVDGKTAAAKKPTDPTRGKYTFLGWFVGDTDNEYVWSTAVTGDITLKAHWQDPWTITFDEDGGSEVADITVKHNTKAEKPADPTKENHDFNGWYYGNPEVAFNWDANVTQDYSLKAHWLELVAKYDIEYYDGETKIGTEEQVRVDQHPTAAGIETSKPLMTFDGWFLNSALTGDPVALNTVTPSEGLKIYGKWSKAYAANIDFEAFIDDNTTSGDWEEELDDKHYAISSTTGVTLDAPNGKPADKGLKIKNSGSYLSFNVHAGKLVLLKAGVLSGAEASVDGGAHYTTLTGATGSTAASVVTPLYNAAEAEYRIRTTTGSYNIIQSITIQDPYQVTFDANGGEDVASLNGTPSVTLPLPVKGTESFLGWFDGETKVGMNGDKYTPTANITLVAHWEAISTDARLSAITFSSDAGTLAPAFDPEVTSYTYTMPYGTAAIPTITGATSVSDKAQEPVIVQQAAAWNETAIIRGKAQSGDTKAYNVTMKMAPKDGVVIIHADIPSGTSADYAATGLYAGTGNSKNEGSSLKLGTNHYAGVNLSGSEIFKEGDILNIHVKTKNGFVKAPISTTNAVDGSGVIFTEERSFVVGNNFITLTSAFEEANSSSLYLVRTTAIDAECNPAVDYIEVTRAMNPVLTAISFNGVAATKGTGNAYSVTLPEATTNLASMTIATTVIRNAAHATTPEAVISNSGAWKAGDNTYRVMDKDGDYTDYTITIILQGEAPAPDITTQPLTQAYCAGSEPTLSVTVDELTDGGTLSYAWFKVVANDDDEQVGSDATYTVAGAGTYYVVVTNHVDTKLDKSVTSENAVVTLNAPASITTQPTDLKKQTEGANITLSVVAANATAYQWYSCDNKDKENPSLIAGANAANYEFEAAAGFYYCEVTGLCGNVESNVAQVTVKRSAGCQYITATSGLNATLADGLKLYAAESDGKQSTSGTSFATASSNVKGLDAGAVGSINKQYILVQFPVDVEEFTIYGYNSSNRYFNNLRVNDHIGTTSADKFTSDMELSNQVVTKTNAKDGNEISMTAELNVPIAKENYVWIKFNNALEIYRICYTAAIEKPVIATQPATKIDFAAGDMTATVVVNAVTEGTLKYQWYNADGDVAVEGATSATLTTTEEGTYYVIVRNTLAGHKDYAVKSSEATLAYRQMNDATLSALSVSAGTLDPTFAKDVLEYRVDLPKNTTTVPTLTATATMAAHGATAVVTNATEFVNYEAISTVLVTAEDGVSQKTYTVHYYVAHAVTTLADVTENTTWDWSLVTKKADGTTISDDGPKLNENEDGLILASYLSGDDFDKLEGNDGAYAIRNSTDKKVYQGASLRMHTTKGGYLSIWAANEGNSMTLNVANAGRDMQIATLTSGQVEYKLYVQAGDVRIYNVSSASKPMRVSKIVFTVDETPDYTRPVSNNIGTLCVEHNVLAGGALGATFYQIASRNETYPDKIDFEEVLPGEELKAGQPYIFRSNTGKIELFFGETEATQPVAVRGMIGNYAASHLDITDDNKYDILYIAQNKLWNCEDLVESGLILNDHRAYINMSDVPTYAEYEASKQNSNAPSRRRVTLGINAEQVATGVENVQGDKVQCTKVLINGQLFILRGEKMYDATGRLVK